MSQTITVKEAIQRGQRVVNAPIMIILFAPGLICLVLNKQGWLPEWPIGVGLIAGFVFAWLYWSIMITKWRIWVFENVDDPLNLKYTAIVEKLIWPDGSVFEKTEIRTARDKERLKAIAQKIQKLETEEGLSDAEDSDEV